jgi:DNA repair protein RadC
MTPTDHRVHRVRELVVTYSPIRCHLPVPAAGRLTTSQDAAALASRLLAGATVETVLAFHLDTKYHLIGVHVVSTGLLDSAAVHPRDVFKAACLSNAAGLILAHNHPSGDPTPSPDDRRIMIRLREAGEILGVELLDSLIVVDPAEGLRYVSFRDAGLLV